MAEEMLPGLRRVLGAIRTERAFDPASWVQERTEALNSYMRGTGLRACVVNLSGGLDSAVTLALACHAASLPGSPITRILGLLQPIESTPEIQNRAYEVLSCPDCARLAGRTGSSGSAGDHQAEGPAKDPQDHPVLRLTVTDQTKVYRQLKGIIDTAVGLEGGSFAAANLKSYMRTPSVFYAAQLLAQAGEPALVLGTGNLDEDGFLFYFSKAGDGVSDAQLIHDLHKSEVRAVGRLLGVPASIIEAAPSADLWPGQTDENEIGAGYDFVELYTSLRGDPERKERVFSAAGLTEDERAQYQRVGELLEGIHRRNSHKAHFPVNIGSVSGTSGAAR